MAKKFDEIFENLYEKKIFPQLAVFEKEKNAKSGIYNFCVYTGLLTLFLCVLLGITSNISGNFPLKAFLISFILSGVSFFAAHYMNKNIRKKLKAAILTKILSLFGIFAICENENISLKEIKTFQLFPAAKTKHDDDRISGVYQEMPIHITETELSHTTGNKSSSSVTDFHGLIIKTGLNKKYKGKTIIKQIRYAKNAKNPADIITDSNTETILGTTEKNKTANAALLKKDSHVKTTLAMEKVTFEDAEFNNLYSVQSNDQIEARYIITPTFMERLKNIREIMAAGLVHCVIENENIYIFIETYNDFFEVGSMGSKTLYNKEIYKKTFTELYSIFNLIHYFKLDQKTGL